MENNAENSDFDNNGNNYIKQLGNGDTNVRFILPAWRMNEIVDFRLPTPVSAGGSEKASA